MCFIPRRPPKSTRLRANCSLLFRRAPMRKTTKSPSISTVIRLPATSPTAITPRSCRAAAILLPSGGGAGLRLKSRAVAARSVAAASPQARGERRPLLSHGKGKRRDRGGSVRLVLCERALDPCIGTGRASAAGPALLLLVQTSDVVRVGRGARVRAGMQQSACLRATASPAVPKAAVSRGAIAELPHQRGPAIVARDASSGRGTVSTDLNGLRLQPQSCASSRQSGVRLVPCSV